MKRKLGLAIIVLVTIAIAIMVQAGAEKENVANVNTENTDAAILAPGKYSYAAKFVCGDSTNTEIVVPGKYLTAINVHNPYRTNITLYKKVVRALPEDIVPIPPSTPRPYKVQSDYAFEIDCQDIRKLGGYDEPFIKGFVVLYSPKIIDVVGVYTSTQSLATQSPAITLDIERVEPVNITI